MQLALIGLLLLATTPATSNEAAPAPSTQARAASAAPAEEPRKVCRKLETTGSRTAAKKVCMTAEQWRKADLDGF